MNESVIWKYEVPVDGKAHMVSMPDSEAAQCVLCLCLVPFVVTVWMQLNPDAEQNLVPLTVVGTGQRFPEDWYYIGSCRDREYIWHVIQKVHDEPQPD